jgi:hypothetical protein
MESKKQTAVEWLYELSKERELDKFDLEQAKYMEKQQINKACYDGYYQEELYDIREYYNDTYK